MRFVARILFGIDMSAGILIYTLLSLVFGVDFDPFVLVFSVFFSFAPDCDMIPYVALRKKWNLVSHHVFFHHPAPVVFLVGIAGWLFGGWYGIDNNWYAVSIAVSGIVAHFAHDAWKPLGMKIFSPFSKKRFSWAEGKPHWVIPLFVKSFYEEMRKKSLEADSAVFEFTSRIETEKLGPKTKLLFVVSVASLFCFWVWN